jgi:hypothetical protein
MSALAEELARLGGSLGDAGTVRAAAARLEEFARRLSTDSHELGRAELGAIRMQAEALAKTVFELNRAVSARVRALGLEVSHGGQS